MAEGNRLIVQYGLEPTWGTFEEFTHQIRVASEGFKLTLNKAEEGLLTGGRVGGKFQTLGKRVEGTISTLARPDDLGIFLFCAMGDEEAVVIVNDAATSGYQELGLSTRTPATATGLVADTIYYFEVNVDDAGAVKYDITTDDLDTTYAQVLAQMNAEVPGAVFAIVAGDVRCTSATTGVASKIALAEEDDGEATPEGNLFATLTNFVDFEVAVDGAAAGGGDAFKHTFTMVDTDLLPSMSWALDRIVKVYQYTGVKINTLSFNAASGDFLKLDVGFVGKNEGVGVLEGGLSSSPLKAFKLADITVLTAGGTSLEATSVKFDFNNNLDAETQTTATGLFVKEPLQGTRALTLELEALYDANAETVRDGYFLTDDDCEVIITFVGDEISSGFNYTLTLTAQCQITEQSPVIGGAGRIRNTLNLTMVDEGTEPLEIELTNGRSAKYEDLIPAV